MPSRERRAYKLSVRLTDAEARALRAVAAERGTNAAAMTYDAVRRLVARHVTGGETASAERMTVTETADDHHSPVMRRADDGHLTGGPPVDPTLRAEDF